MGSVLSSFSFPSWEIRLGVVFCAGDGGRKVNVGCECGWAWGDGAGEGEGRQVLMLVVRERVVSSSLVERVKRSFIFVRRAGVEEVVGLRGDEEVSGCVLGFAVGLGMGYKG